MNLISKVKQRRGTRHEVQHKVKYEVKHSQGEEWSESKKYQRTVWGQVQGKIIYYKTNRAKLNIIKLSKFKYME